MEAEYHYSGHTDRDISEARRNAEALFNGENPLLYLNALAHDMENNDKGSVELLRMKRVAEFVCNPDETGAYEDRASFLYGELAAEHLLLQLTKDNTFKAGSFAHDFLEYRMRDTRELERFALGYNDMYGDEESDEKDEDNRQDEHFLTPSELREEHISVADDVRQELSGEYGVLSDEYEEYLDDVLEQIQWKGISYHHFMIGFRIVMREFDKPSVTEDTEDLLEITDEFVPEPSGDPEEDRTAPTVEALRRQFYDEDTPLAIESLGTAKRKLIEQFIALSAAFKDIPEELDETTAFAMRKFQESQLQTFNRTKELFLPNDIIFVDGNQAVCLDTGETKHWITLRDGVETFGTFERIVITKAPNKEVLTRELASKSSTDETSLLSDPILTPAIRITNPTINFDGGPVHCEGQSLEIPLIYKSVAWDRLAENQFEDALLDEFVEETETPIADKEAGDLYGEKRDWDH